MKVTYTYYSSNILEDMLFATEEDALNFDKVLDDFINDSDSVFEFERVVGHYASLGSVLRAIDQGEFHYGLIGNKKTDPLIKACENMVSGRYGLKADDKFREAMLYILNKLYQSDEGVDN